MSEPRDQNRFLVRMPEGMRDRIKEEADLNKRSMNAEIVARLESTFPRFAFAPNLPERLGETPDDIVRRHMDQYRALIMYLHDRAHEAIAVDLKAYYGEEKPDE